MKSRIAAFILIFFLLSAMFSPVLAQENGDGTSGDDSVTDDTANGTDALDTTDAANGDNGAENGDAADGEDGEEAYPMVVPFEYKKGIARICFREQLCDRSAVTAEISHDNPPYKPYPGQDLNIDIEGCNPRVFGMKFLWIFNCTKVTYYYALPGEEVKKTLLGGEKWPHKLTFYKEDAVHQEFPLPEAGEYQFKIVMEEIDVARIFGHLFTSYLLHEFLSGLEAFQVAEGAGALPSAEGIGGMWESAGETASAWSGTTFAQPIARVAVFLGKLLFNFAMEHGILGLNWVYWLFQAINILWMFTHAYSPVFTTGIFTVDVGEYCGNAHCGGVEYNEDCFLCEPDCPCAGGEVCDPATHECVEVEVNCDNDGICEPEQGENCYDCGIAGTNDCACLEDEQCNPETKLCEPLTEPQEAECGNGVCEPGETWENCPEDCPRVEGETAAEIFISIAAPKFISFEEAGEQKTDTIAWTLTNVGEEGAHVITAEALDCGPMSCSIEMPDDLVIAPMQSAVLVENISATAPAGSEFHDVKLKVQYTDESGEFTEARESLPVSVYLLNMSGERFHTRLEYEEQNFCISADGTFGRTGERAVPFVHLSWDWADIDISTCDKENSADTEFIYCDPVQFSIELARKLNKIETLVAQDNTAEIEQYTSFQAFLIKDNFSEDFQKDFAYYYEHSFFNPAGWFTSATTPWNEYFSDSTKLVFEPRQLEQSGLYNVSIEVADPEFNFFDEEGNPNTVVTIKFELVHPVGVEVPDSPFYHLPFNGLVGTLREEGGKNRADYGLGYNNTAEEINLSFLKGNFIQTAALDGSDISGATEYLTDKVADFESLNLTSRGKLLTVDLADNEMSFSPGYATPIIMGIESHDTVGEAFYSIADAGGDDIGTGSIYLSLWDGAATSDLLGCKDFYGAELYYMRQDAKAGSFDQTCVAEDKADTSFGFRWSGVENNEMLFLKSIFYSPFGDNLSLRNACDSGYSLFASSTGANGELSSKPSQSISLNQAGEQINTLQELIDSIGEEKVCVAVDGEKSAFFWNAQKIEKMTEKAEALLGAEWQFNWSNFDCTQEVGG